LRVRRRRMNRQQGRDDAEAGTEIWDPIHRGFLVNLAVTSRRPSRMSAYAWSGSTTGAVVQFPCCIARPDGPLLNAAIGPA
jgi:hypothetical protein